MSLFICNIYSVDNLDSSNESENNADKIEINRLEQYLQTKERTTVFFMSQIIARPWNTPSKPPAE